MNRKTTTARATLRTTMSHFQRKYSDEQRDAFVSAVLDRGGSAAEVARNAARGDLIGKDGQPLPAFGVPANTIRAAARQERNRRLGREVSNVAQLPHRDATEALRVRLVSAVDFKLREIDRKLKRDESSVSFEELRQAARAIREAQALPGRNDPRTPAPGAKTNGTRDGGETKGGLSGQILKAHRTDPGLTASETPTHSNGHTENTDAEERSAQDAEQDAAQEEGQEGEAPGSLARGLAARSLSPA